MKRINIAIFADKIVGRKTVEFILQNYFNHLKVLVVKDKKSDILSLVDKYNVSRDKLFFSSELQSAHVVKRISDKKLDYILLAWWPYIIKENILAIPKIGTLNFHPSYLPYNRGMHYNFWSIVEETPFGVSIHFAIKAIDAGDIIFQKKIEKNWEDTGETLYKKAQKAMFELFVESYPKIVKSDYVRLKQDKNKGSFHYGRELEPASQIFLDKKYKLNDLLNLLRARTFANHPACYFFESGEKYEVRVEIKKVKIRNEK